MEKETKREKIIRISNLMTDETMNLTRSRDNWLNFLEISARLYKRSFNDIVIIAAHKPDVEKCALFNQWNDLGYRVKRGATGIPLIRMKDGVRDLIHVFDVSDTVATKDAKDITTWAITGKYERAVTQRYASEYGLTDGAGLESLIAERVKGLIDENLSDWLNELENNKGGLLIEELDRQNLTLRFREIAEESINLMICERCGIHRYVDEESLKYLGDFNTYATIAQLGDVVTKTAQTVLTEISKEVRYCEQYKNERIDEYGKDNDRGNGITDVQRGERADIPLGRGNTDLSADGRLGSDTLRTDDVDTSQTGISRTAQTRNVSDVTGAGNGTALDGDKQTGERNGRSLDGTDVTGRGDNGGTERERPDNLGAAEKQPQTESERDNSQRNNLRISDEETAEENKTPAVSVVKTIEIEKYSERDENGRVKVIGHLTAGEVFEQLQAHLKNNNMLPDDFIDYFKLSYDVDEDKEIPEDAEFTCHPNFGGSEGIYLDIAMHSKGSVSRFITGKTLEDGYAAFKRMGDLATECNIMLNGNGWEFERPTPTPEKLQSEKKTEKISKDKIIGNTTYKYISDKKYRKVSAEFADEIASRFDAANIKYSGKINDDDTVTFTFGGKQKRLCSRIIDDVTGSETKLDNTVIMGNTPYDEIPDKTYTVIDGYIATELMDYLNENKIMYSSKVDFDAKKVTLTYREQDKNLFLGLIAEIKSSINAYLKSLDEVAKEQPAEEIAVETEKAVEQPAEEQPYILSDAVKANMPDSTVSIEERNEYGYTDNIMLPLNADAALDLFNKDLPVYMLYEDNTESIVETTEDIKYTDVLFGIEADVWEKYINSPAYKKEQEKEEKPVEQAQEELIKGIPKSIAVKAFQLGTGYAHGKFRVEDLYKNKVPKKTRMELLKKEFGIGGSHYPTDTVGDISGFDHMGKNFVIEWVAEKGKVKGELTWNDADKILQELVETDTYISEKERQEYDRYNFVRAKVKLLDEGDIITINGANYQFRAADDYSIIVVSENIDDLDEDICYFNRNDEYIIRLFTLERNDFEVHSAERPVEETIDGIPKSIAVKALIDSLGISFSKNRIENYFRTTNNVNERIECLSQMYNHSGIYYDDKKGLMSVSGTDDALSVTWRDRIGDDAHSATLSYENAVMLINELIAENAYMTDKERQKYDLNVELKEKAYSLVEGDTFLLYGNRFTFIDFDDFMLEVIPENPEKAAQYKSDMDNKYYIYIDDMANAVYEYKENVKPAETEKTEETKKPSEKPESNDYYDICRFFRGRDMNEIKFMYQPEPDRIITAYISKEVIEIANKIAEKSGTGMKGFYNALVQNATKENVNAGDLFFMAAQNEINNGIVLLEGLTEENRTALLNFAHTGKLEIPQTVPEKEETPASNKTLHFYKLGDFYEAFGADARTVSEILDYHIVNRNGEKMTGFPIFNTDNVIKKFAENGYTVELHENINERKQEQQAETLADKTAESHLGFGLFGNGITVYDKSVEDKQTRDYLTVAHISEEGTIKYYVDDLTDNDISLIQAHADDKRKEFIQHWNSLTDNERYYKLLNNCTASEMLAIGDDKDINGLSIQDVVDKYFSAIILRETEMPVYSAPEVSDGAKMSNAEIMTKAFDMLFDKYRYNDEQTKLLGRIEKQLTLNNYDQFDINVIRLPIFQRDYGALRMVNNILNGQLKDIADEINYFINYIKDPEKAEQEEQQARIEKGKQTAEKNGFTFDVVGGYPADELRAALAAGKALFIKDEPQKPVYIVDARDPQIKNQRIVMGEDGNFQLRGDTKKGKDFYLTKLGTSIENVLFYIQTEKMEISDISEQPENIKEKPVFPAPDDKHGKWSSTTNPISNGDYVYSVFRLKDKTDVDYTGNREYVMDYIHDEDICLKIADALNDQHITDLNTAKKIAAEMYAEYTAEKAAQSEIETQSQPANVQVVEDKPEDSIAFSFGHTLNDFFSESNFLHLFHKENPEISFALANAVLEYLDEKQHTEREIEGFAGGYDKTDFHIEMMINGEEYTYSGRYDIGDGKASGGGSIADHIRDHIKYVEKHKYLTAEEKEEYKAEMDIILPFLEKNSVLTAEEQAILDDFKSRFPIRTGIDTNKNYGKWDYIATTNGDEKTYSVYRLKDSESMDNPSNRQYALRGIPDREMYREIVRILNENNVNELQEAITGAAFVLDNLISNAEVSNLDTVKQLIADFCDKEYEVTADFSDLTSVDVAYTEIEDEETGEIYALQASFDLKNNTLKRYIDNSLVETKTYDSLEDLIKNELDGLNFNDLLDIDEDIAEKHFADHKVFYGEMESIVGNKSYEIVKSFINAKMHGWENDSVKSNRIKKAIYDILGDEQATEKAFKVFLDNKDFAKDLVYIPPQAKTAEISTESPKVETVKAADFILTEDKMNIGSPKQQFKNNIAAIRLLKELENTGAQATPEQQDILAKYMGWGGLSDAFDSNKTVWAAEYEELKEVLTDEEYRSANASVLNSHFTSPTIISAVYAALGNMGFEGGRILEPAMGVGNFFGAMPQDMRNNSNLYGVEIDDISGRIAKQLYPSADIQIKGFQNTAFNSNSFDVVVGNVPFANTRITDKELNSTDLIHDFFFKKTMDKLRPGGVAALITSVGTMDKIGSDVRRYLAERGELLGAIRLPMGAFKNANTEAAADIIFLQKREIPLELSKDAMPDWVELKENAAGARINAYFADNPEMVLGKMTEETTQYGKKFLCRAIDGADFAEQLSEAVKHIGGSYTKDEIAVDVENAPDQSYREVSYEGHRNFCYCVVDDKIYFREGKDMIPQNLEGKKADRMKGLIKLSDTLQELLKIQREGCTDEEMQAQQEKLNTVYEKFTKEFGLVSSPYNKSFFRDDDTCELVGALENLNDDGTLKSKADIFTKRTFVPYMPPTHADTVSDALTISISEKAKIDFAYMTQLCGKNKDEMLAELQGIVFEDPETGRYETADEYLSGNVREKLRIATLMAESNPKYAVNVEHLKAVQPAELLPKEISVNLGSTWVPSKYYEQFMYELLKTPDHCRRENNTSKENPFESGKDSNNQTICIEYDERSATFGISNITLTHNRASNALVTQTYGTERVNAYKVLEDTLNNKTIVVKDYYYDNEGKIRSKVNKEETLLAQQKQAEVKAKFQSWIWGDYERTKDLCKIYNEKYNSFRPREYDGSHLKFVGMNPNITLRPHQVNAIAHTLYGGNTLLAHTVGAGKTFEMVASAMEAKRLGLCKKSLMCVPKHIVNQFAKEFMQLYPNANILVATEKDFTKKNRRRFFSRIATGNYDAVIISHSQLEKLPLEPARQERFLQKQIDETVDTINALYKKDGKGGFTVKQLEIEKQNLEDKLKKLQAEGKKDTNIFFEDMGFDRLYIDEAHAYKNRYFATKIGRNIAGINASSASQRATDLEMKIRYMDEITDCKGTILATGTPEITPYL